MLNAIAKLVFAFRKGAAATALATLVLAAASVTSTWLTMVLAVLEKVTTEISYVLGPPTGISVSIALASAPLIVFQLPLPMLPDESRMNPSWMTSARAGVAAPSASAM